MIPQCTLWQLWKFAWCKVFHNCFDLKMSSGLLEYVDLLPSVYNSNIVWFYIFCLSSTLKEVLGHNSSSSSYLILARSLAPFACLFTYWLSWYYKFSIIGLISWLKFSFLQFCSLILSLKIVIFSWGGIFRKYISVLFKTRLGVLPPATCWRVAVFCVFNKK